MTVQDLTALLRHLNVSIPKNVKKHWLIEEWNQHQHLVQDVGVVDDDVTVTASVYDETAAVEGFLLFGGDVRFDNVMCVDKKFMLFLAFGYIKGSQLPIQSSAFLPTMELL